MGPGGLGGLGGVLRLASGWMAGGYGGGMWVLILMHVAWGDVFGH